MMSNEPSATQDSPKDVEVLDAAASEDTSFTLIVSNIVSEADLCAPYATKSGTLLNRVHPWLQAAWHLEN
eukprot:431019-Ditylum_brightwellii.AAC.1